MYELIAGDCLTALRKMPDKSVDCIVTDPPYGIGLDYGHGVVDSIETVEHIARTILPEMIRVAHRVVLTCGVTNLVLYPPATWTLCWYSPAGTRWCKWGFSTWQPILVYGKDPYLANRMGGRPDSISKVYVSSKDKNAHPCPKPVGLMVKLIRRVSVHTSDTILDPFLGSGTTGVAAAMLSRRRFIGIDINPDYVALARARIDAARPLEAAA